MLGVTVFRKRAVYLLKYFYGFEMPLLFFILLRIITFRDFNAGVFWLNCNVVIALTTWLVFIWMQNKETSVPAGVPFKNSSVALSASTILALVGLYFGILFLILMLPVGGVLLNLTGLV
ncbi:hypothetical protein QUF54_11590, partial [Candidatus Marithioploca araucensis]|nr:hypothetical protein [Candidatus Marithioploca araucensis]